LIPFPLSNLTITLAPIQTPLPPAKFVPLQSVAQ
jgi:hypothetical protein